MYMQKDKLKKRKGLILVSLFIIAVAFASAFVIIRQIPGKADEKSDSLHVFNTKLPDANLKQAGRNKLEIYMQADKDSAKLKELQQKDPSGKKWYDSAPPQNDDEVFADEYRPEKKSIRHPSSGKITDHNERKVNDQLKKLYAAIDDNGKGQPATTSQKYMTDFNKYDNNIAQLEAMLKQVQQPSADTNPEMKQIESVLDKILEIQNPDKLNNRVVNNDEERPGTTYNVSTSENAMHEDSLINQEGGNAFFGLQDNTTLSVSEDFSTISAVVHNDQLLQNASIIKLRLLQDIYIKGTRIPSGTFVFGQCSVTDQRLVIRFNSIAYNNIIYPVQLTAFDIDGNEGIYVPGAIGRDEAKGGVDRAIQQMQLTSLNPSIGAQAATAGIQAAQNFLSKKVKRVQVHVKAGIKCSLSRANQTNNF
jgi:conjugative transposon TraM protein